MATTSIPDTAARVRARVDGEWDALRPRLGALPVDAFDRVIPIAPEPVQFAGPTRLREVVAIVAFWVETAPPVVAWGLGRPQPDWPAWYGGDTRWEGWPPASEHHAREAAWSLTHSPAEGLARLDAAHTRARATLATLTDAQLFGVNDYGEYGKNTLADKYRSCVYGAYAALTAALP